MGKFVKIRIGIVTWPGRLPLRVAIRFFILSSSEVTPGFLFIWVQVNFEKHCMYEIKKTLSHLGASFCQGEGPGGILPPLEPGPPLGGIGPLSGPWTLSCNGPFLSGVGPLSGMGPLLSGPLGPLSLLIGRLRSLDDLEFGSSFLGLFAGLWTFRGSFCFLGILYLLGSSGVNSFSFSAYSFAIIS